MYVHLLDTSSCYSWRDGDGVLGGETETEMEMEIDGDGEIQRAK